MELAGRIGRETTEGTSRYSVLEANFIASEILTRADVEERRQRLAKLVSKAIVPRLIELHVAPHAPAPAPHLVPTANDIDSLAHLVLGPDTDGAVAYVEGLRAQGLPMDTLFVELLEPAARHLGQMWDRDECDFIDVTLGVARLQKLLSIFNATHELPALNEKRTVLMAMTPGDQHFFGGAMVAKFLRAGGWEVTEEPDATADQLAETAAGTWFAVVGLTLGSETRLDNLAPAIRAIRRASRNQALGVMVGGPIFVERPELVAEVGADGTAPNAPAAVLMAQKLFDIGALGAWGAAPL